MYQILHGFISPLDLAREGITQGIAGNKKATQGRFSRRLDAHQKC